MPYSQLLAAVALVLLLTAPGLHAQSPQPYIKAYSQEEYGAEGVATSPQNWDITQDEEGLIYLGNTNGIFEFDGKQWNPIPNSNSFVTKGLAIGPDKRIYAFSEDAIGRIEVDSTGRKNFKPINIELGRAAGKIVIRGYTRPGKDLLFITQKKVIVWNGENFRQYRAPAELQWITSIGETVMAGNIHDSLFLFDEGRFQQIQLSHRLNQNFIYGFRDADGTKIFIANNGRFYRLQGLFLKETDTSVKGNIQFTNGISLPKGLIALGTNGSGLFIVNRAGKVLNHFTTESGLVDNTISKMYMDREQGLWLAHSNGLSKVELFNPLSLYDLRSGIDGIITSILPTPQGIWVATLRGIYYSPKKGDLAFKKIREEIEEGWKLIEVDKKILAATSSGIFEFDGAKVQKIAPNRTYTLTRSRYRPDIIYAGLDHGVGLLQKQNGQWRWLGQKLETGDRFFYVAEDNEGRIWATEEVVYSFTLRGTEIADVKKINIGDLALDTNNYNQFQVSIIEDNLLVGWPKGVLIYDKQQNKLVISKQFDFSEISPEPEIYLINEAGDGTIWLTEKNKVIQMAKGEDGIYRPVKQNIVILPPIDLQSLAVDSSGIVWIGTANGLFRYNSKMALVREKPLPVILKNISINDTLPAELVMQEASASFPIKENNFIFEFLSPSYKSGNKIHYSYMLEGYDNDWSIWSSKRAKEYTNLPEGDYRFLVKARNSYGLESDVTDYTFTIRPPFYRTWWAYLLYLLLGLCAMGLIYYVNTQRHRQQLQKKKEELEREQAINKRLRQADRLKDEFLANTSHELKTPLMGIIGMAESLKDSDSIKSNEEVLSDLALISASGKRLSNLVNSILDYSRLKEHDLKLTLKPIDLSILVSVVLRMSKTLSAGKFLKIENRVPRNLPPAHADENRLQQILVNLVSNAIKFTSKGNVAVGARLEGNEIVVSVKDTGIGIPADKHQVIFQSFEQVDNSETREFGGTGLGLAITKKLVELHSGRIWMHSEPGQGSEFFFTLPVSEEAVQEEPELTEQLVEMEETEPSPQMVHKKISANDEGINLLIVDDEPINQQVLQNYLSAENYNLLFANNGAEALEIIEREKKLDLVLLDIMMPRMSGYEVCRRIREKYPPNELPVIFITAKNQVKDLVQAFSQGGNDYLVKPFSKNEFLARVKTHLNLLHINSAYQRFVPKEFIRTLGKENILDVHLGDQVSGEMTVMFSDIRDYTGFIEQLTPAESFEFLNLYLKRVGPIINHNHGFVEHFYGDGIMALFPHRSEDAFLTAIQMQEALHDFKYNHPAFKGALQMGVGIHSGSLMLGILGHSQRMDTGVVSDTVNTASRIEGMSKYFGANIMVSEYSLKRIQHYERYSYRFMGKVQLKGKKEVVKLYEIYDGDHSNIKQLKDQTLDVFNEALEKYYQKEFASATALFEKVLEINPDDKASRIYIKQCTKYGQAEVPEEWSGIEVMEIK